MDNKQDKLDTTEQNDLEDGTSIEEAFHKMEILYKSRCIQAPLGANITIREIKTEEGVVK